MQLKAFMTGKLLREKKSMGAREARGKRGHPLENYDGGTKGGN